MDKYYILRGVAACWGILLAFVIAVVFTSDAPPTWYNWVSIVLGGQLLLDTSVRSWIVFAKSKD